MTIHAGRSFPRFARAASSINVRPFLLRLVLGLTFPSVAAACGGTEDPGDTTHSAPTAQCNSIELLSATLTVVRDDGGLLTCGDVVVHVESPQPTDGGAGAPTVTSCAESSFPLQGCPQVDAGVDAGVAKSCSFAIGYDSTGYGWGSVTVSVSSPAFSTETATVTTGVGGCVTPVPPTNATVSLQPEVDAGP